MNAHASLALPAARGFTLVEVLVVCLLVALLAAVALPSFKQRGLRMGRLDAVEALMKIRSAQEQYRSLHGFYANDLAVLQGSAPVSSQGLYAISLDRTGPESFVATATARGGQVDDSACRQITLLVNLGFPTEGPTPECWQR